MWILLDSDPSLFSGRQWMENVAAICERRWMRYRRIACPVGIAQLAQSALWPDRRAHQPCARPALPGCHGCIARHPGPISHASRSFRGRIGGRCDRGL